MRVLGDAGRSGVPRAGAGHGGNPKGLAADAVAHRLGATGRHAVDCGGDVRVAGAGAEREPFEVEVAHPFTGEAAHRLWLGPGAIATSGIDARLWRTPPGATHTICWTPRRASRPGRAW